MRLLPSVAFLVFLRIYRVFSKPNMIFIVTDEHRYDTLSIVQDNLKVYKKSLRVKTPNLDKLAQEGVHFETAYCQYPLCGPSRTSLFTGNTVERTGVQSNALTKPGRYTRDPITAEKVQNLESFEQVSTNCRVALTDD